jgi:hypothetical protein
VMAGLYSADKLIEELTSIQSTFALCRALLPFAALLASKGHWRNQVIPIDRELLINSLGIWNLPWTDMAPRSLVSLASSSSYAILPAGAKSGIVADGVEHRG